MNPAVLGVMIPIIAIVLGLATGIVSIVAGHRERLQRTELRHRERLTAIEKGLEIPPDPVEADTISVRRPRHLLRGLVCLCIGLTLTPAMWQLGADMPWLFGLVPAGIGVGYLVFYVIEGRHESKPGEAPPPR
jgi:uncharacterized protein DUF6249